MEALSFLGRTNSPCVAEASPSMSGRGVFPCRFSGISRRWPMSNEEKLRMVVCAESSRFSTRGGYKLPQLDGAATRIGSLLQSRIGGSLGHGKEGISGGSERRASSFAAHVSGRSPPSQTTPAQSDVQAPADGGKGRDSEEEGVSFFSFFKMVRDAWVQGVISPLGNFGMGQRSIREGSVGLFMMSGVLLCALIVGWVQGVRVRARTTRYQATFVFGQAQGLAVGTPVRIRGVDVGSVVGVRPSLEKIDAVVEILDDNVVIPRNSTIEVNQSGLISETLIDITPQLPIPQPSVGPTHPKCPEEGLIVCDRESISGQQGVSLDELVGICTKIAKEMDKQGVSNMFDALDKFAALAEEAKPLVEKVNAMAGDVQPMLSGMKDGELLKNLERLSSLAVEATKDLKELNTAVLSDGNAQLLRESVSTLTKTLKHIESISADVSTLTGDPSTRSHLKQLIESLSRIVVD